MRAVRSTSKSPGIAPDSSPRRVALIGFGLAGAVIHAPLIETTPGLRLTTIVTGDPERAVRARREYPEAAVEPEAEAVWARAAEHGLVVIAAPNSAHVPLARRAIDEGLAIVVDKPLAPSSAEARELTERAAAAGVALTVFQNRRWDSDFLTLRQLIDSGELGEIHRFESRFERWRPELQDSAWRESASRAEGGGLLLDLGTHLIDQALVLFGPVSEVYGEADHRRGGRADDDVFLALRHESGVRSHLWASSVAASRGPRMRVLGSHGAFVVDQPDGQEEELASGRRPRDASWGAEPEEGWGRLVRGDEQRLVRPQNGDWPEFYRRLSASLDGRGELPVDPRDAVATLEILERIGDD